ncbi:MAG: RHS repeat-associated core domain-containing protein [Candidatus Limiplasma sp.]|nr:RHS repeat-associated core domain-containing protein [Candidatus Limiplasma sp.]
MGWIKGAELDREARMAYDLAERPAEAELYENGALQYRLTQEYDRFEQPSVLHERVEEADDTRSEYTIRAQYDKESKPTALTYESAAMTGLGEPEETSKRKLAYAYDGLGRIVKRSFYTDPASPGAAFQSEYAYVPGGYGPGSTTALVRSIRQADGTREYVYDSLGNILRERRQNKGTEAGALSFEGGPVTSEAGEALTLEAASMGASDEITYAYDPLGQLIRVDDEREGATWTYRYDQGGNILEKKRYGYTLAANLDGLTPEQVIPYAYGDTNWKDRLTAYDGKPIACDPIGNPLFYDGWTYAWKAGRMLHRMVRDGVDAQFTYDHTGLRVKKSVNGVDTLYTLNGKRITHMRKGPVQMHFFYDAQGRPAMVRYNDTDYAYLQNLQGDVTGIVDMTGAIVVEYRYDAWGKPVATIGSMAETLGYDNPFRYRGYVYDEETGLYYLRSRYYDPVWGRFVNADSMMGRVSRLCSHNLFAYCLNQPVTQADSSGKEPLLAIVNEFLDAYDPDGIGENLYDTVEETVSWRLSRINNTYVADILLDYAMQNPTDKTAKKNLYTFVESKQGNIAGPFQESFWNAQHEQKGNGRDEQIKKYYTYVSSWREGLTVQKIERPTWPKEVTLPQLADKRRAKVLSVAKAKAKRLVAEITLQLSRMLLMRRMEK